MEKFVFHNTSLPFENLETLPKRNDFENKTIVLGLDKNPELILKYADILEKKSLPYLLIHSDLKLNFETKLKRRDFPLFRIYFSEIQFPELAKESKSTDWENELIKTRLKDGADPKFFSDALSSLYLYSSGSLYEKVIETNEKFFLSYLEYAKYYYKKEKYNSVIQAARFAFLHKESNANIEEISYQSLKKITPEKNHISIMKILLKKNIYKVQISRRLYPLYLSLNETENAIFIIDDLIQHYTSIGGEESKLDLKNLKIEKAKIYLQASNIRGAEEIILNEQRKETDSIVWQKLKYDLQALRDSTYKVYLPQQKQIIGTENDN